MPSWWSQARITTPSPATGNRSALRSLVPSLSSFAVTSLKTIFPSSTKPAQLLLFLTIRQPVPADLRIKHASIGVPIVSARLPDFELMAANENMAIRFYKVGDAAELANQLLAILQSPELEHEMAEQNFAAGLEMTMTSIIQNYLRWFELKKLKRDIASEVGSVARWRRRSHFCVGKGCIA